MTTPPVSQPSLYVAAYAAGVLMFFAPCSVGLLPAYLTYYLTRGESSGRPAEQPSPEALSPVVEGLQLAALVVGATLFLAGAVPLFYMAVAGVRIELPGYDLLVPLARFGTGSYLPVVALVLAGTAALGLGTGRRALGRGLRVGAVATAGIAVTYVLVGAAVLAVGRWVEPYLTSLELLVGPLLVAFGVMYYRGVSPLRGIRLPERGELSDSEFFVFGVLYGVGSLACNLPVFLGVVVSVFGARGFADGLGVFAAFAAGMGTLMTGVSVLLATGGRSFSPGRYADAVRIAGSAAFVVLGLYVTWYTLVAFGYL